MTRPDPDAILMAQIGAPHGVRGEVRIKPFSENPLGLGDFGELSSADGRTFRILGLRPIKGAMLVARLDGVTSRDAAEALNGTRLYVPRSRLPEPDEDEFYHADLIGCSVVDGAGAVLGTVVAVPNYGAGDLLDIARTGQPSLLVPFNRETVPEIDLAARRVVVDLPEEVDPDELEPGGSGPDTDRRG